MKKHITHIRFLFIAVTSALLAACGTKTADTPKQQKNDKGPNILFLLADDLGYGELGCYGQEVIKTPVLDSFASQGMRFTNFYAGSPVCSPSRAVLMTGISSSYTVGLLYLKKRSHWEKC